IPRFLANGDRPGGLRLRGRGLQSPGALRARALGRFLRGCSEFSAFARCAAGALELAAFYRVSANAPVRKRTTKEELRAGRRSLAARHARSRRLQSTPPRPQSSPPFPFRGVERIARS